jgi:hypothetical protein
MAFASHLARHPWRMGRKTIYHYAKAAASQQNQPRTVPSTPRFTSNEQRTSEIIRYG